MFIVYLVSQYDCTTRDKEFDSLESVYTPDYRKLTGVECLCSLSHSGDLHVSPCPSHVSNSAQLLWQNKELGKSSFEAKKRTMLQMLSKTASPVT